MAYELSWVTPSRVLRIELENEVTIEEMTHLVANTHTYVNAGQAPVHILIDATRLLNKPVNFQEFTKMSKTMSNPSTGWWVLMNPGKMVWFAASILSKLLQIKLKSAQSTEEALTILSRVDLTLDTQPTLPVPT